MRKFSVRPTLTLRGRTFKGLRGWSGKPSHPPLTDIPIAAYVPAAVFDVVSAAAGKDHTWARDLWHAGTFSFLGGAAVVVRCADRLLGFVEVLRGWDAGPSDDQHTRHDHGHRDGAGVGRPRLASE